MSRFRLAALLAWRLSIRARPGRRAAASIAAVAAVSAFLLASVVGVQGAARGRAERLAARTPELTEGSPPAGAALTRWSRRDDEWDGRRLDRIVVDPDPAGPLPPGITAFPAPGTSVLSPALLELSRHQPDVRARFGRIGPEPIGPAGRGEPNELVAYTVVAPGALGQASGLVGFGGVAAPLGATGGLELFALLGILSFVAVPASLSLLLATRIGEAARRRQTGALRRSGLSARLLAAVQGLRCAAAAALGAFLGVVGQRLATPALADRDLVGHRATAAELAVGPVGGAAIVVGSAVLVAVIVAFTTGRDAGRTRPSGRAPGWTRWSAGCLVAGVAALVASRASQLGSDSRRLALDLALLLLVLGCPAAIGLLAARVSRSLARRPVALAVLLAARRVQRDAATVARPAGVVAAIVLVVCFANGVISQFTREVRQPRYQVARVQVDGRGPLVVGLRHIAGADETLLAVELPDPHQVTVLLATCAQLDRIEARPLSDCTDGAQPIGYRPDVGAPGARTLDLGPEGPLALGSTLVLTTDGTSVLDGSVKVDPSSALGRSLATRATGAVVWTAEAGTFDRIRAAIAAADPRAQLDVPDDTGADSARAYRTNGDWFRVGSWLLLVASAPGLLLAVVDLIGDRRRQLAALAVMGVQRSVLVASTVLEVGGVLTIGVVVGALGGLATSASRWAQNHDGHPWARASTGAVALTLLGTLLIGAVAAWRVAAVASDPLPELDR